MALGRFFGRGRDDKPAQSEVEELAPDDAEVTGDDMDVGEEVEPEVAIAATWRERAESLIPGGASTGSKRADKLYGEIVDDLPTHFSAARGAVLTDTHGTEYLDCTMALGAVALGYAEPRVTAAVIGAATEGNVAGLSSWREVELADRLRTIIPCAERVQFLKTGAEAVAAAVRLARVYTGKEQIIACGYFGWHDWCSDSPGVPLAVRRSVDWIPFDEMGALDIAVAAAEGTLAAIVIEPIVEQLPTIEWLQRAREWCDKTGAVLIFDEIKTGFRVAPGGYQEVCGVIPDLATFGKALANGFPLSAVVGREALMNVASETWISSTLASESTALAAALAVIEWYDEADICATLAETGREMRSAVERAIAASGVTGVRARGIDSMWFLQWDDEAMERQFLAEAARNGVLFKRGAYNFAAVAHDDAALRDIEHAASVAMVSLREVSS